MLKRLLLLLLFATTAFATVPSTETKREYFTCNGTTTTFTFISPCNSSDDIQVSKKLISTGEPTLLVEDTDYTITNTGSSYLEGGVVTISPALASTYQVVILREIVTSQETASGAITPVTIEAALDKLTRESQDVRYDLNYRALIFPQTDPDSITGAIPNAVDRAGKVLGFDDSTGAPTAVAELPESSAAVSTFMEGMLDDVNAAIARGTLGMDTDDDVEFADLITKGPWVDVRAFGDYTTDIGNSINLALASVTAGEAVRLLIPSGTWDSLTPINLTSSVNHQGVVIQGMSKANSGAHVAGIHIKHAGVGIDMVGGRFVTIRDLLISGDATTTPTIGILMARNSGETSAGEHFLENVNIEGNFSTACVYSYGSEVNRYVGCRFYNREVGGSCVRLDSDNTGGAASTFATIDTADPQSDTEHRFIGCHFNQSAATGNADNVFIRGVHDILFSGCFFVCSTRANFYFDTSGSSDCGNVTIDSCRFEGGQDCDYCMQWAGGQNTAYYTITNNRFDSDTKTLYTTDSRLSYLTIFGNHVTTATKGYYFDSTVDSSYLSVNAAELDITTAYANIIRIYSSSELTLDAYGANNRDNIITYYASGQFTPELLVNKVQSLGESDATPSVAGGNIFKAPYANTITDFDDGLEGQVITMIAEAANTITDGTNIFLEGSQNFVMADGDSLSLVCKADNKWYELSRMVDTAQTFAASNVTTDRTFNADSTSTAELADVLGTLVDDLRARGIVK